MELWFKDPVELRRARLTVRTLRKTFEGAANSAWLDVKKTREQLKPSRIVHRIAAFLEDNEATRPQPCNIEKNLMYKNVKRDGEKIGSVHYGLWRWTAAGEAAYDQSVRQHAEQWALE